MKEVVTISGKGGTGKTSLVAAFACIAKSAVIADCDVDAANLHLVLQETSERAMAQSVTSGYVASLTNMCTQCGVCVDACRFGALTYTNTDTNKKVALDVYRCEGCGVCSDVCPKGAVTLIEKTIGKLVVSNTRCGPMVSGRLGIAASNSGKLVNMVKTKARKIAAADDRNFIIVDGSPGLGCPVISSLSGAHVAVIVTEPTVSGLHDLERVTTLCKHFKIPSTAVINKWNLNPDMADKLEKLCFDSSIPVIGRLPFDTDFPMAISEGKSVIEVSPQGTISRQIREIWNYITSMTATS